MCVCVCGEGGVAGGGGGDFLLSAISNFIPLISGHASLVAGFWRSQENEIQSLCTCFKARGRTCLIHGQIQTHRESKSSSVCKQ